MTVTETETATDTGFTAVPPFAFPAMEWRPEYGTLDDEGTAEDLGDGVHVWSSPDISFSVNSLVVTTTDGVLVVDSQLLPRHARAVVDSIRERTDQPIRYAVNSHHHPDHVFGNPVLAEAGAELVSSWFTARMIDGTASSDLLFLMGMYGEEAAETFAVPRTTYVRSRELWLGDTAVQLFEANDSTTVAGESIDMAMTWLPQTGVLHVGDLVEPGSHAFFAEGVSVPDWLVQLEQLREVVAELDPRVIVPGHGRPGDASMIDEQAHYLTTVAAMVEDHCRGGEVPLDDAGREALRAEILSAFPGHRNPIPLDISLEMIQMLGPVAFLNGRPDGAPAPRLPSFR